VNVFVGDLEIVGVNPRLSDTNTLLGRFAQVGLLVAEPALERRCEVRLDQILL
jgi:hypothetical protein